MRIRGLRTAAEAAAEWPSIMAELAGALVAAKKRGPGRRRPQLDAEADWLRRSLYDVPLTDWMRADAEAIVAELKRLAGAAGIDWKKSAAPGRRGRPRVASVKRPWNVAGTPARGAGTAPFHGGDRGAWNGR